MGEPTTPENTSATDPTEYWPEFQDAYRRLWIEAATVRDRYREALESIESMSGAAGAGQIAAMPIAERARKALS